MQRISWVVALGLVWWGCTSPYADIPREPPQSYYRAESYYLDGELEKAIRALQAYLDVAPDETFRARAYYQLAQAQHRLGRNDAALDTLERLEQDYPKYRWVQVAALRGDILHEMGLGTEAVLSWEEAWVRANAEESEALRERLAPAIENMDDGQLYELDELLVAPEVHAMVRNRLPEPAPPLEPAPEEIAAEPAELAPLSEDELPPLEDLPDLEMAELEPLPPVEEDLGPLDLSYDVALVETAPPAPPVEEPTGPAVAAILPLTGPDKSYGIRSLTGIRLAVTDTTYRLIVKDSGGDPDRARALLEDLAADPDVMGVVGPLRTSEARMVAPRAEDVGLPTMLLSPGKGNGEQFVFRVAASREEQVEAVVGHARETLEARRFAVLYPDDAYGRELRNLFRREVGRQGGSLVGSRAYLPGQVEFGREAAAVRSWVRDRRLDAVFIPDSAGTAVMLATELRRAHPELQLIGTESWNRPSQIAGAGGTLDGAIFADAFFVGSPQPTTQTFVERFRDKYGRAPTVFEAQAFDAARLIVRAAATGADTRLAIASHLHEAGSFEGAGHWRTGESGITPRMLLLEIRNGEINEAVAGEPRIGG